MSDLKASDEVRQYLAAIGSKGGKRKSPKQRAQFAAIQAMGPYKVTPKRLAQLARARAARWAKAQARKQNPVLPN